MSSTQKLTQLPTIQYTGMDYSSVISEIKNIIENNKNWKSNWTQFYSSEAGTMLIQLMSWICDNLAVRQDLIYNENYLATASTDSSKQRLLKQIGYFVSGTNGAKTKVAIEIKTPTTTDDPIYLSNHRKNMNDISSVLNSILRFTAPDINGKKINWEILAVDNDDKIRYKESVILRGNSTYYTEFNRNGVESPIYAIQGETKYTEFTSADNDEVVFNFGLKNFDTDSIAVFDLTDSDKTEKYPIKNGAEHLRVNSFHDLVSMSLQETDEYKNIPCYIVERDDYGYLRIRYPGMNIMKNNSVLESHGFKPGHTIGVFYRTSNGTDGNIVSNYINSEVDVKTSQGRTITAKITNILSAYGGREAETIESAIKTAPLSLRSNDRAVTIEDFDRVLQKNSLVSNSISYSPDNEPVFFKNYYGRNIYPHEVFSFISSNKNFSNIPTERLNYFPWIDTIKESVMNEYYNFFECEINKSFNIHSKSFGGLLEKNVDENSNEENVYINTEAKRKGVIQKNSVVYKTSLDIGSKVNAEYNDKEENVLKVKFHTSKFNGQYIKDISNDLFDRFEDQEHTFTTKYEIVEIVDGDEVRRPIENCIEDAENYHATFTSKKLDLEKEIDVLKYSKFNVVIDDILNIEVDLKIENLFSNYLSAFNASGSESDVTSYYLMYDNNPITSFKDLLTDRRSDFYKENRDKSKEELIEYYTSSDIAKYRKGILQLGLEAWEKYKNKAYENENENENGSDTNVGEVSEELLNLEMVKGNIQYADIGLQYPEFFLGSDTFIREDGEKFPFFRESIDKEKRFYFTVKINGNIYAFAIDETAVKYASEFYDSQRQDEDKTRYYDVFKYIGTGPTFDKTISERCWEEYKIKIAEQIRKNETFRYNMTVQARKNLDERYGNNNWTNEQLAIETEKLINETINLFISEKNDNEVGNTSYHVKLEGDYSYQIMPEQTANFFRAVEKTYTGDFFWLTLDRLAALMEFEISPYHRYPNVLLRYDESLNNWVDTRDDKINGIYNLENFRVTVAKRPHCSYASANSKNYFTDDDYIYKIVEDKNNEGEVVYKKTYYSSGNFEYDLRFENIIPDESNKYITIESISDEDESKLIGIDSVVFKDFFSELFGNKKYITRKNSGDSFNLNEDEIFSIKTLKDGYKHFVIKTPTVGKYGTLSLSGSDIADNCFISNELGGSIYAKKLQNESIWYTDKSYGIRKLEMFVDKYEETYLYKDPVGNEKVTVIQNGDFIFTDNDINLFNSPSQIYISYKSNEKDSITINTRNNFCYIDNNGNEISYSEYCKNQGIEELVSIEGGIYYLDDENKLRLNKTGSDFAIKITKNPVDTNNFYNVNEDSLVTLNSVKSDNVSITTDILGPLTFIGSENNDVLSDGEKPTVQQTKDVPMPFKVGYDVPNLLIDNEIYNPLYEVNFVIYNTNKFSSDKFYEYMQTEMQNKSETFLDEKDLKYERNLFEQRKIICRYAKDNSNKIVFTNFNKNGGNIVFYYPSDKEIIDYNVTEENVSIFYKKLFGTNKTNSKLYKLYPRSCMDEKVVIEGEDGEYWYCPRLDSNKIKHNVIFKYRYYEGTDLFGEPVSRYADYYIEAEENIPEREINEGKGYKYSFTINKTKTSNFPDTGFYLHYMHDRSPLKEPQLEENIIQKYMQKYMIAGTDINILKPYFKTFDIEAKIYFNANYDEEIIKTNLENALKEKYHINNIKNIVIGNKIYLSDITMLIMNTVGVEHAEIIYFGFDATDKENNPTQTKYLSSGEGKDFYTMVVLANNSRTHGLLFSYEKNQE